MKGTVPSGTVLFYFWKSTRPEGLVFAAKPSAFRAEKSPPGIHPLPLTSPQTGAAMFKSTIPFCNSEHENLHINSARETVYALSNQEKAFFIHTRA